MKILKKALAGLTSLLLVGGGLALTATPAYAVDGVIPDQQLAECFNEALGRDVNTPITEADVNTFTGGLSCSNRNITNLEGLQHLTTFDYLDLSFNEGVSDINVLSNVTSIGQINLSSTSVSDITALTTVGLEGNVYLENTNISTVAPLAGKNFTILNIAGTNVTTVAPLEGSSIWYLYLPDSITNYENLVEFPALRNLGVGTLNNDNSHQINANITGLRSLEVKTLDIPAYSYLIPLIYQLESFTVQNTLNNITDISSLEMLGNYVPAERELQIVIDSNLVVEATYEAGTLTIPVELPQPILNGGISSLITTPSFQYDSIGYDGGVLTFTGVPEGQAQDATISFSINPNVTPNGNQYNPWVPGPGRTEPTNVYMNSIFTLNVENVVPEDEVKTLLWLDQDGNTSNETQIVSVNAGQGGGVLPEASLDFAVYNETVPFAESTVCSNPSLEGELADRFSFTNASSLNNTVSVLYADFADLPTGQYSYTLTCNDTNVTNNTLTFIIDLVNVIPAAPLVTEAVECPAITYVIDGENVIATFPFKVEAEDAGDVDYSIPMNFNDNFTLVDNNTGTSYSSSEEYYEGEGWNDYTVDVNDGVRTFTIGEPVVVTYVGAAEAFDSEDYNVTISGNLWITSTYYLDDNVWIGETALPWLVGCDFVEGVTPPVVEPPVVTPPVVQPPVEQPTVIQPPGTPGPETIKNGGADVEPFVLFGFGLMLLVFGAGGVLYARKKDTLFNQGKE